MGRQLMYAQKLSSLQLDSQMAEFCGIVMGDGNIWTNWHKFEVTITGSPRDKDYLDHVAAYVISSIKPSVYYRLRGRGLRLTIYSKRLFDFLVYHIGFGVGTDKCSGELPRKLRPRALYLSFIRGFFDTDGSIFTSDKKGAPNYPTLEITNENSTLLLDIKQFLLKEGIRATFRKSNKGTFKIAVHGKMMIRRWLTLIGSSHPRKLRIMQHL